MRIQLQVGDSVWDYPNKYCLYTIAEVHPRGYTVEDKEGNREFKNREEVIPTDNELMSAKHVDMEKLNMLLVKNGICQTCEKPFSHEIYSPFASCDCGDTEWSGEFTPYMQLEKQLSDQSVQMGKLIGACSDLKGKEFVDLIMGVEYDAG